MSQSKNKLKWCLNKAEKELKKGQKHRGLIKVKIDEKKAERHISKAEHYLKATDYLKKGDFSDISTSTIFYSMCHCLLAIAIKFGYESRNQECTFALIYSLIEDNQIDLSREMLDRICLINPKDHIETSIEIREEYQYGIKLSLENKEMYSKLFSLAQNVLLKTREIIES